MTIVTGNGETLDRAIRFVSLATGSDDRPILSGVLTQVQDGNLSMIAADGFRLHKVDIEVTGQDFPPHIIPGLDDALKATKRGARVRKVKGEMTIILNGSRPVVKIGDVATQVEDDYIDGNYPSLDAIWPKDDGKVGVINRKQLLSVVESAVKEAARNKREGRQADYPAIWLKTQGDRLVVRIGREHHIYGGGYYIRANYGDVLGEADSSGDSISVILDARYMKDVLNSMGGETVRMVTHGDGPVEIFCNEFSALVMPIRDDKVWRK